MCIPRYKPCITLSKNKTKDLALWESKTKLTFLHTEKSIFFEPLVDILTLKVVVNHQTEHSGVTSEAERGGQGQHCAWSNKTIQSPAY